MGMPVRFISIDLFGRESWYDRSILLMVFFCYTFPFYKKIRTSIKSVLNNSTVS